MFSRDKSRGSGITGMRFTGRKESKRKANPMNGLSGDFSGEAATSHEPIPALLKHTDTGAWKDKLVFPWKCQKVVIHSLCKTGKSVTTALNNQIPLLPGMPGGCLLLWNWNGAPAAVGMWE